MNAAVLLQDEFVATPSPEPENSLPLNTERPVETAVPPAKVLPFGLKLPSGKAAFEALWPPLAGIGGFLALWAIFAPLVQTSLGALPGPGDVWSAFLGLLDEAGASRVAAAEAVAAGYARAADVHRPDLHQP